MAGLNAGWGDYGGQFQRAPTTAINKPPQGVDTGPSAPPPTPQTPPSRPPMRMGGGINVGRTSQMGILPSPMDPFRTYGNVEGGRMTPPANPYGQNQPIRFTPGGEWGGGGPGPINTGPSYAPGDSPQDWISRGGFTGQGGGNTLPNTPPMGGPIQSESSGASAMKPGVPPRNPDVPYMPRIIPGGGPDFPTGYYNPQTRIPNMNQGGTGGVGQRGDMRFQQRNALRNAYAGAGPSLSSRPFKSQMFY